MAVIGTWPFNAPAALSSSSRGETVRLIEASGSPATAAVRCMAGVLVDRHQPSLKIPGRIRRPERFHEHDRVLASAYRHGDPRIGGIDRGTAGRGPASGVPRSATVTWPLRVGPGGELELKRHVQVVGDRELTHTFVVEVVNER